MADTADTPYMPPSLIPQGSELLTRRQFQEGSDKIKQFVEARLRKDLNMFKHTAPIAFTAGTGINDDLDGSKSKSAVRFHVPNIDAPRGIKVDESAIKETDGFDAEVVQSLAKWKRTMLQWYGLEVGEGLFCESFSIRKGYKGDVTHSSVVDQWDWEVRLLEEQRTLDTLKQYVSTIYAIIKDAERMIRAEYPVLAQLDELPDTIHFVTAEELHSTWPDEDVHGRENKAVQQWGAIFIVGMGWPMRDGSAPEEVRAPDYDDWTLNGDIMVRGARTGYRHELSSMGVRVNAASLAAQLKARGMEDRTALPYHQGVLRNTLPLCIGGGIGISRLLMHLLGARHIGQVQVGVWADRHHQQCAAAGIALIPDRLM